MKNKKLTPLQRVAVTFETNQKLKKLALHASERHGRMVSVQELLENIVNKYSGKDNGI